MPGIQHRAKPAFFITACFFCAALFLSGNALAADILIAIDRAKIVRLQKPAATIIIGNPAIADVTLHDSQTAIITGRMNGSTNMVIMDGEGEIFADDNLIVNSDKTAYVTIHRKSERFSLSCTPNCEPTVRLGDSTNGFAEVIGQSQQRSGLANQQ